ncbi:cell division protein FtsQ [uncultured Imperialibacter sp.]|uniref:cell division protein FtsQ/DivIB n=1 Tax=uncultured Imperialibacter sp. TaxID=1672639 RepID=UPI0030DA612C|tara:strand:- start:45816 stop:46577 length:762 start_codon:yes stop_codon:yes gene_type:complete
MLRKIKIKRGVYFVAGAILLFVLIGFVSKKQMDKPFSEVYIDIDYSQGNYFIHENDIRKLINAPGNEVLTGSFAGDINLRNIETKIEKHPFVKEAEVFRDLRGNIKAKIKQKKPIARIINNGGFGAYITDAGEVIPLSDNYTARVVLVKIPSSKKYKVSIQEDEEGKGLFEMVSYLEASKFWKAQIAEISMDKRGEMILYPQVTRQYIEFGKAEDIDTKFGKLHIFYTKILPEKGWNTYEKVNVKYKDQIVCE